MLIVWFAGVLAGFTQLAAYETGPGAAATPPAYWPEIDGFERDLCKPTVLFFAHPHCPCTRASVRELARIAAKNRLEAQFVAVFFASAAMGKDWERSDIWRSAEAIPGMVLRADPEGSLARAFGVKTSGEVLAYSADGQLRFHGGITPSRGHEGDSHGQSALVAMLLEFQAKSSRNSKLETRNFLNFEF